MTLLGGLFSDDDIASFAVLSDSYLPDRVTISEQVTTSAPGGGHVLSYSDVMTDVPCRIAALAGLRGTLTARELPANLSPQALFVVVFAHAFVVGTGASARPLRRTDRLIVTAASDASIRDDVAERPLNIEFIDDMVTARVQTRVFCSDKAAGAVEGGARA